MNLRGLIDSFTGEPSQAHKSVTVILGKYQPIPLSYSQLTGNVNNLSALSTDFSETMLLFGDFISVNMTVACS